jgi:hypothetical protein
VRGKKKWKALIRKDRTFLKRVLSTETVAQLRKSPWAIQTE